MDRALASLPLVTELVGFRGTVPFVNDHYGDAGPWSPELAALLSHSLAQSHPGSSSAALEPSEYECCWRWAAVNARHHRSTSYSVVEGALVKWQLAAYLSAWVPGPEQKPVPSEVSGGSLGQGSVAVSRRLLRAVQATAAAYPSVTRMELALKDIAAAVEVLAWEIPGGSGRAALNEHLAAAVQRVMCFLFVPIWAEFGSTLSFPASQTDLGRYSPMWAMVNVLTRSAPIMARLRHTQEASVEEYTARLHHYGLLICLVVSPSIHGQSLPHLLHCMAMLPQTHMMTSVTRGEFDAIIAQLNLDPEQLAVTLPLPVDGSLVEGEPGPGAWAWRPRPCGSYDAVHAATTLREFPDVPLTTREINPWAGYEESEDSKSGEGEDRGWVTELVTELSAAAGVGRRARSVDRASDVSSSHAGELAWDPEWDAEL
ncbi:hypothetical protein CALCODRAFT_197753 [Calocera cornea HHB12733]|uniref:Uncharacterized protein n=1 Tax=Calocera cornea HHB12733 TaxID=1353952 RepID=A0A165C5X5_9BASI|nr:hypothetical protein CALCODRAFT_197753 [Calocera cornea HHB12733]